MSGEFLVAAATVKEVEQRRKAFSAERLDSVAMIAGQLSVSLDNALLYASLEKRVAERTAAPFDFNALASMHSRTGPDARWRN